MDVHCVRPRALEDVLMYQPHHRIYSPTFRFATIIIALCLPFLGGCQEFETIKRELIVRIYKLLPQKKKPFVEKDGITILSCRMYMMANKNSEVIRRLPAETPVRLIGKMNDWYQVRTRDGGEGFLEHKMVGGEQIIIRTQELRKSIEGLPPQAEGITKNLTNFRLDPGREHKVIEVLPPGKKLEVYERVVTLRENTSTRQADGTVQDDAVEDVKKDVWYKVKMEDGRVGYIYTHNMKLSPPPEIARAVTFLRMVAWKAISTTDDPDMGPKNNYVVAYAPIGKDPGCDYTTLYLIKWSTREKRMRIDPVWRLSVRGILPITDYHFQGKSGFSLRYLHPTSNDKLVMASYVYSRGRVRKVSEEEIPNPSKIH